MIDGHVRTPLRMLAGHSLVYGVGGLLLRSLGLVLLPLYTHLLTPGEYGIVAVGVTLTALLGVVYPLALHGALARLHFDCADDRPRAEIAWTLWIAVAASSFILALLLDAAGPVLFGAIFREVPYSPYLRLAIWTACFSSLTLLPLGVLQLQERSTWYVAATSTAAVVTALCIVFFTAVRGEGAAGYLRGSLLAMFLLAVGYAAMMLRVAPFGFRMSVIPVALAYSLPLVPHGLAGWALGLSDRAILERYVSLEQLGLYALAAQLAGVLTLVATSINTAWVPLLFRAEAAQQRAATSEIARLVTYYALVLTWVGAALVLLLRPGLRLLAAPAYQGAYPLVPWMIAGALFNGLYLVPANVLFLRSRTGLLPVITVTAGLASMSINLILAPLYGVYAAAWANCAAYGLMFALAWAMTRRVDDCPYEYGRIARVLVSGATVAGAGTVLNAPSIVADVLLRIALCAAFPVFLYLTGFFTIAERASALAGSRTVLRYARGGAGR